MTCEHIGRIEKDLPCPDPSCPDANPRMGVEMHVPRSRRNIDTGQPESGVAVYRLQFVAAARRDRPFTGYWRWDGPTWKPLKP